MKLVDYVNQCKSCIVDQWSYDTYINHICGAIDFAKMIGYNKKEIAKAFKIVCDIPSVWEK